MGEKLKAILKKYFCLSDQSTTSAELKNNNMKSLTAFLLISSFTFAFGSVSINFYYQQYSPESGIIIKSNSYAKKRVLRGDNSGFYDCVFVKDLFLLNE